MMDIPPDQPVPPTPDRAEQQVFIDLFRQLHATSSPAGITLTNIYKEMPITHPATIVEIHGRHVELHTCELQLAAIVKCNEAYLRSPLIDQPILGRLDQIDVRLQTVRLTDFSYQELKFDKRTTVRVRFKKPIAIVAQAGQNKISGYIHDISLGGCCINTLVRKGLEDAADIVLALKLLEESTGQTLDMQFPCSVIRFTGDRPPFMCALRFSHTPQSEQLLSIYINQRQHEILKELRESF
jgi:hypothetical protein